MASMKMSVPLRGSLAGLLAVAASAAAFGGEAEGVVRIRSTGSNPTGTVIRGQSPSDCVPWAPAVSARKIQSGAPVAALRMTPAQERAAPEPRVTPIAGQADVALEEYAAPAASGEFAGLFNSESAAPFTTPFDAADAAAAASPAMELAGSVGLDDVSQAGHRRQARKEERRFGGSPSIESCPPASYGYSDCPPVCGEGRVVLGNNCLADKLRCCSMNHRLRSQQSSDALARICHDECNEKFNWFRCKFGYFFPSGTCGKGTALAGHYSMVYPVNPSYSDPRDSQVYAAQGYYGPVAVPLAPDVHHTYNYGWGVPSSRLTPVGNYVAPY